MRKKVSILAITLVFVALIGIHFGQVKAAGENFEMNPGASIRTEGVQGLKFSATFDPVLLGSMAETDFRGFFIMYGEATVADLLAAAALVEDPEIEPVMVNEKPVKREANYDKTSELISVVLTGIPLEGYNQAITVVGFTEIEGVYTFSPTVVTRSIAEVALNAAKAGQSASVSAVLAEIESNYFKAGFDEFGNYAISSTVYQNDREELREEFIADWNSFSGTAWTSLNAATFFASAKEGSSVAENLSYDLSGLRIFTFFNDEIMGEKWGWFLTFISNNDGTTHPTRQIVAIRDGGKNGEYQLYNAEHLSYSIVGFFNKTFEKGINFTSPVGLPKYYNVKNYNDKIFMDYADFSEIRVNDLITLPAVPEKDFYTTNGYKDGSILVPEGAYTVVANKKLEPRYVPISYDITYMDGATELTALNRTYTVEVGVTLATYVKEGFIFDGWYDNAELSGPAVTSITLGDTGDKIYYAKTTSSAFVSVEVTYGLNGGQLNSTDLYTLRTTDVKIVATQFRNTTTYIGGAAITINTLNRASWYAIGLKETGIAGIYEVVGKNTIIADIPDATLYLMMHDDCTSSYKATFMTQYNNLVVGSYIIIENVPTVQGTTYSVDVYFIAASEATASVVATMQESAPMFAPVRVGYTFGGWSEQSDGSGPLITTYPGYTAASGVTTKTYYAKWTVN